MSAHSPEGSAPSAEERAEPHGQKRKRAPRALLACESCRSRKLRCDQLTPCTNCSKRSLHCEYRSLEVPLPKAATKSNGQAGSPQSTYSSSYQDPIKRTSVVTAMSPPESNNLAQYMTSTTSSPSAYTAPTQPSRVLPPLAPSVRKALTHSNVDDSGFEEVNRVTHGTEYYGPVSLFSFLRRLRERTRDQRVRSTEKPGVATGTAATATKGRDARDMSIVNLLHSTDFPVTSPSNGNAGSPPQTEIGTGGPSPSASVGASARPSISQMQSYNTAAAPAIPFARMSNQDIERECVRLYFINLHIVHPIIDQVRFMERCEAEIWGVSGEANDTEAPFLALFNAVLAVGAIQAGEDAAFMRDSTGMRGVERVAGGVGGRETPTYPPLKLAKLFFERAKMNLGDVFEACSLESTQSLFLMAVFCQNALKPHSCYLYCGMAVRSALAIGLPNYTGPLADVRLASATWWGLYSFEIEMCAAAGRDTSLKDPSAYHIVLPHIAAPDDPKQLFSTHMIDLARITAEISEETEEGEDGEGTLKEKSRRCQEIDRKLVEWKNRLPPSLNFETSSLTEPVWVSKQKVVLRNRFLNTRLLIHRPFLIAAASSSSPSTPSSTYTIHVSACVSASVRTIETLYEMYQHRPYFRTWWYNTTYTLYASMILCYVVLSNIDVEGLGLGYTRKALLEVCERAVEIFQAMSVVGVARRCVEVTQEVLEIARRASNGAAISRKPSTTGIDASQQQQQQQLPTPGVTTFGTSSSTTNADTMEGQAFTWPTGFGDANDPLANLDFLVDPNLMDGLMPYGGGFGGNGLGGFSGDGGGNGGVGLDFLDFNSVLGGYS